MDEYYDSEEFKQLLRKYEEAAAEGRSIYMEADDLTDIAEYYHMTGYTAAAHEAVDYALSMFPDAPAPKAMKARMVLIDEGNTIKAEEMFEESFAELYDDMEREDFIIDVASLYIDYELYDYAERWLLRATDTDDLDYKELSGKIALHRGNYEESERIFNELIDRNPYSTPYWNNLASTQFLQNNIRESIQSSEFAIAINPNDADAILNKANGLFSLGNFKEAEKFYARFSELCPDEESGEMFQGICEINLNNLDEGIKHLKEAELIAPEDSENLFEICQELAFALSKVGKADEALAYAEKMLHCKGADANETRVMQGHLLMEAGRWQEAKSYYSKAITDSGCSPHIFLRIAISIYDLGYHNHSYRLFQVMKQLGDDETRSEGYAYEALCCYALGKDEEFREAVKKACEKNPREAAVVLSDLFPEDVSPENYYQYLINVES